MPSRLLPAHRQVRWYTLAVPPKLPTTCPCSLIAVAMLGSLCTGSLVGEGTGSPRGRSGLFQTAAWPILLCVRRSGGQSIRVHRQCLGVRTVIQRFEHHRLRFFRMPEQSSNTVIPVGRISRDQAPIIDAEGMAIRSAQRLQFGERTVPPQEGTNVLVPVLELAGDVIVRIDCVGTAPEILGPAKFSRSRKVGSPEAGEPRFFAVVSCPTKKPAALAAHARATSPGHSTST